MYLFYNQISGFWDGKGGVWYLRIYKEDGLLYKNTTPERLLDGVMINKPLIAGEEIFFHVAIWNRKETSEENSGIFNIVTDKTFNLKDKFEISLNDSVRTYDEPSFVKIKNNIYVFLRTKLGIHFSKSIKKGRVWNEVVPFKDIGDSQDSKFHVSKLKDNRIVFIFNNHASQRKNMVLNYFNEDFDFWNDKLLIDERNNVSYPDMTNTGKE